MQHMANIPCQREQVRQAVLPPLHPPSSLLQTLVVREWHSTGRGILGDCDTTFIYHSSESLLEHLGNSFSEKMKDAAPSGDRRQFQVGRMQLLKTASCQCANTEIVKYVCWWPI